MIVVSAAVMVLHAQDVISHNIMMITTVILATIHQSVITMVVTAVQAIVLKAV